MALEVIQSKNHHKEASAAQKSAIDALQKFYGLIVAIAFTGGVLKFLEVLSISTWTVEQLTQLFLFLAFVSTIVPFYHGMERHLFDTHVARKGIDWGRNGSPSNILVDIFAFMIMGALLVTMGRSINDPKTFLQLWSALLVVDIIWSLIVWNSQKGTKPFWTINNLVWLIVAWCVWYLVPWLFISFSWHESWMLVAQTGAVAVVEISRSVFDYLGHWKFYFPDEDETESNIIYLAGPYSNNAPVNPDQPATATKRLARFNAITDVARQLIEKKALIYSPLTMTHPIDIRMSHDPGSQFWVSFDEALMRHCNEIYVLRIPGWDKSSGVQREIDYFSQRGISPTFLDPADFNISAGDEEYKAAFE